MKQYTMYTPDECNNIRKEFQPKVERKYSELNTKSFILIILALLVLGGMVIPFLEGFFLLGPYLNR
jgi:hypothetical protein